MGVVGVGAVAGGAGVAGAAATCGAAGAVGAAGGVAVDGADGGVVPPTVAIGGGKGAEPDGGKVAELGGLKVRPEPPG